jgi:uncharacterized protein DUF3108
MKQAAAVPLRPLLLLGTAVSAVHLLLLRAAPEPLHVLPAATVQPFITRSISVDAGPVPAAAEPPPFSGPSRAIVARRGPVNAPAVLSALQGAPGPAPQEAVIAPAVPMPAAPAPAAQTGTIEPGAPSVRIAVVGSMRLRYQVAAQVRGQAWAGEGELVWRHDGENYEAKLETSAPLLPTRTQRSTGRITAEGLAPLRFSEKARTEEAAHFQRDAGKVSFSSNKPDAALLAGAQDRLSVLLQLGAMLAGQPRKFPPGATIAIQTAGTRDAEPWLFTVEQEELLDLPGGMVNALKLTRQPRKEFDQRVELWLAPGMDYVPVRLRLTQPNGESVNYQWSSTDKG